jgi:putative FmdB family regulatory protein
VEDPVPTYQYACTECDHAFEQFQSFSEDSLSVCPRCEGRLRKVFNAVGVVFKGSGFYRTDNRSESKSSSSSSATESGGSSSSSDGGSASSPGSSSGDASGSKTTTSPKPESKSASPAA